ncbi:unnamed protein product [Dovyalis caffra]|uniref:PRA1 family protein n=1 Tax=Dovyalis caffra TaxID=77055 RepID=A0AAV1QXI4_9ROSI|nr:unnamed protein product [Dovyalis caffra]
MDWGNVTAEDLIGALKEIDWTSPPRPLNEFFSKFTIPRSYSKWSSRLKCNLYYYRTNYFILILLILGVACILRPLSILATALSALAIAFLNDSFAASFSEKVTRTIRKFSPHLAAKMRPPHMPVIRGRPSAKKSVYICGQPRLLFVLLFSAGSFLLWYTSGSLLYVCWAHVISLFVTVLHASFRTPNLKARLNTFREEFRAVWRNYILILIESVNIKNYSVAVVLLNSALLSIFTAAWLWSVQPWILSMLVRSQTRGMFYRKWFEISSFVSDLECLEDGASVLVTICSQMASSSHRQRQLSLTPRDNHSHGCITHKMKTSTCIEDSMKKLTITTETTEMTRKHRPQITVDKQRLLVKEEKHVVREKEIVNNINLEKEKKRIPHKHRSAADGEKKIVNNVNVEKEKKRIPHKHKSGII